MQVVHTFPPAGGKNSWWRLISKVHSRFNDKHDGGCQGGYKVSSGGEDVGEGEQPNIVTGLNYSFASCVFKN